MQTDFILNNIAELFHEQNSSSAAFSPREGIIPQSPPPCKPACFPLRPAYRYSDELDARLFVQASVFFSAAADRKITLAELKNLKSKGSNTVCPDYPQPAWFYELCDELGLYVIDRANINAPDRRDDRRVGGTPSNDPALADEYLERVKAMYYRSRNHTCVVAFALGGESGNGYNMYKAYEWLKSVEKSRPVIYTDADGEWNSDL